MHLLPISSLPLSLARGCLAFACAALPLHLIAETLVPKPARGGGLDTNAPMIHVDIFYDFAANEMKATLDTNYGVPKLVPLPAGYTFNVQSNSYVLSGKAYNLQYAWNPGGTFTPPAGAAVWIECLSRSPGLENYDGPGNKDENPPRPYTPILGTAGSVPIWKWYGRMAHNAFAISHPTTNQLSAEYRVYFGDAVTGARDAFAQYDDATVTLTWTVDPVPGQDIVVVPARGGGLDTNSPMIHVDIFYDAAANVMNATVDTNYGIPKLVALPTGYAFNAQSNYNVLSGKAYNFQFAWNPGGAFTPPAGAAVWIERLNTTPGLENYDGPGNKMENPPRPYTPILGTAGTPTIWKWYGRMAHNAYAIYNPKTNQINAEYRVYFGDAMTGSREAFTNYDDAVVRLNWSVDPVPDPVILKFGATDLASSAPLRFLNRDLLSTNSGYVLTMNASTGAEPYECPFYLEAVAATAMNGGPVTNHAALGACLEMEWVSLTGPSRGSVSFWDAGSRQPQFTMVPGAAEENRRIRLSVDAGAMNADPYGCVTGRRLTASQPGLYCLTFRMIDTSANGPQGSPLHAPSELCHIYLQAGTTIFQLVLQNGTTTAHFGSETGRSYYLEQASQMGLDLNWKTVAGPIAGNNTIQILKDMTAGNTQSYYRLRSSVP